MSAGVLGGTAASALVVSARPEAKAAISRPVTHLEIVELMVRSKVGGVPAR
jgi:hypothetical protein